MQYFLQKKIRETARPQNCNMAKDQGIRSKKPQILASQYEIRSKQWKTDSQQYRRMLIRNTAVTMDTKMSCFKQYVKIF